MTDEPFLSRWSRLKRTGPRPARGGAAPVVDDVARPGPNTATAGPAGDDPTAGLPAASAAPPAEDDADATRDLPPVESLTAESDFTGFLRQGVPEALQRQALRKLWTSDPVLANLDGLVDYAEDYNAMFARTDTVKTLFRVGKGMLDTAEAEAEAAAEAEAEGRAVADSADRAIPAGGEDDGPSTDALDQSSEDRDPGAGPASQV